MEVHNKRMVFLEKVIGSTAGSTFTARIQKFHREQRLSFYL